MDILKSRLFWVLVVGLLTFVAKFFLPTFPFDETQVLAAVLFILGLFGVVPAAQASARMRGALATVGAGDILKSLPFWTLVAGLVAFVVNFFAPTFPFAQDAILGFIVFILGLFQINPELRARGLK